MTFVATGVSVVTGVSVATGLHARRPLVIKMVGESEGRIPKQSSVKGNELQASEPFAVPSLQSAISPQQMELQAQIEQNRIIKELVLEAREDLEEGSKVLARGDELIERLKREPRNGPSLDDIRSKMLEQNCWVRAFSSLAVKEELLAEVLATLEKNEKQQQNVMKIMKNFLGKALTTPIPEETILSKLLSLFPFSRIK